MPRGAGLDTLRGVEMFAFIGETLRRLRKERGNTLEELGQEAKLGRGQLSRIENARQEATLGTLAKILEAQGVTRREFFRRYDLVEAEALAVQKPEEKVAAKEPQGRWPEDLRGILGRVESFLREAFQDLRPVAQGAIEFGEYVVLFRVLPKDAPEVLSSRAAEAAADDDEPEEEDEEDKGKGKGGAPGRGRSRGPRKRRG